MAQRANPQPGSDSLSDNRKNWTAKRPAGNARVGDGQGGTDKPVVERLESDPGLITHGQSKDSRFRKGPR